MNERMRSAFVRDEVPDEAIDREEAVYGGLAAAVRGLVDAVIRTEVDEDEAAAVRRAVEELTDRLRVRQLPSSYGTRLNHTGRLRNWGNAVIGPRNAVAPPLVMVRGEGRVAADFVLGAAYEGPPGLVHGGVSALILDQALGEAAAAGGHPGMTGTLTLRYREATPLGQLRVEAELARVEGIKAVARGRILARPAGDAEPVVCVEAEGLFILPRWAREESADPAETVEAS